MSKRKTIIAALVLLAVLLFSQDSSATHKGKIQTWEFYAAKETACYLAEQNSKGLWLVKFNSRLKPFKANEYISNVWLGETTYTDANGLKTTFYFFEIEAAGVVFPIAVLSNDLNRVIV